jgi:hypothetical protein
LEWAQACLKLPNARALSGQSQDYKRHGTTTLFAALEVTTRRIITAHPKRRRKASSFRLHERRRRLPGYIQLRTGRGLLLFSF